MILFAPPLFGEERRVRSERGRERDTRARSRVSSHRVARRARAKSIGARVVEWRSRALDTRP
jgi:hypothetical protein